MTIKPLTINEVLRFANHDFLNQLNLIQMNLDLQRIEEAKQIIKDIANDSKMLSNINKLQLPRTSEWLQTFAWRFPAIELKLYSDVKQAVNQPTLDETIVQYLENTVIHIYDGLDAYAEHQLQIVTKSDTAQFQLIFHLTGNWEQTPLLKEIEHMCIDMIEVTQNSLHYILSAGLE
ncbi:Spo0B domain-containing protein [Metasolibacillus meyeri]|uniref:Spo0B domain-containing protein n=1 Tax=Metasolibacillus meyeri TaxID=1071052 RepID=A0AAW9NQS0_9BACL|nr:Spo0B domain-containing protein [Metasolibacillus meyeri]MEC1178340.1 Spo0B domain-containing protein [Metasolibacillus meyeri]